MPDNDLRSMHSNFLRSLLRSAKTTANLHPVNFLYGSFSPPAASFSLASSSAMHSYYSSITSSLDNSSEITCWSSLMSFSTIPRWKLSAISTTALWFFCNLFILWKSLWNHGQISECLLPNAIYTLLRDITPCPFPDTVIDVIILSELHQWLLFFSVTAIAWKKFLFR